jgi:hypothetical protein
VIEGVERKSKKVIHNNLKLLLKVNVIIGRRGELRRRAKEGLYTFKKG